MVALRSVVAVVDIEATIAGVVRVEGQSQQPLLEEVDLDDFRDVEERILEEGAILIEDTNATDALDDEYATRSIIWRRSIDRVDQAICHLDQLNSRIARQRAVREHGATICGPWDTDLRCSTLRRECDVLPRGLRHETLTAEEGDEHEYEKSWHERAGTHHGDLLQIEHARTAACGEPLTGQRSRGASAGFLGSCCLGRHCGSRQSPITGPAAL